MSIGGDWKELFRASETGDLALVRYHLKHNEVDPNWQHPEFFSAPLFEAIRNHRVEAVKLLLDGGADPLLVEEMTDSQPLEVALQEKQHDIVDLLLAKIPSQEASRFVKTILITGAQNESLMKTFLHAGHRLIVLSLTSNSNPENEQSLKRLRDETENKKLLLINKLDGTQEINSWVHHSDGELELAGGFLASHNESFQNTRIIWIASSGMQILSENSSKKVFIVEPDSVWSQITSVWWYNTFLKSIYSLATDDDLGDAEGKVFDYRGTAFMGKIC
jgi:hypothetical protein